MSKKRILDLVSHTNFWEKAINGYSSTPNGKLLLRPFAFDRIKIDKDCPASSGVKKQAYTSTILNELRKNPKFIVDDTSKCINVVVDKPCSDYAFVEPASRPAEEKDRETSDVRASVIDEETARMATEEKASVAVGKARIAAEDEARKAGEKARIAAEKKVLKAFEEARVDVDISSSNLLAATAPRSAKAVKTDKRYVVEGEDALETVPSYHDVSNQGSVDETYGENASTDELGFHMDKVNEEEEFESYMNGELSRKKVQAKLKGVALAVQSTAHHFKEAGLLGYVNDDSNRAVYLNTHEPFCLVTVGVQGVGKSHTLGCVLESCLIPFSKGDVTRLNTPMTALVLHYDHNTTSVCEATGLVEPNATLSEIMSRFRNPITHKPYLPRDKMIVLVSPSYYKQRKAFYGDYCTVKPLLFRWSNLSADHIKRLMSVKTDGTPLYMKGLLDLLRRYQREAKIPAFDKFFEQLKALCTVRGQKEPLDQRLNLIAAMVAESDRNKDIRFDSLDLAASCKPGTLVIVDLTDPLLSREDANGIFQVLTEQFRALPVSTGKLLALDEAHKFMHGDATDGLSEAIVNAARMMRHDGMRLVVSTQSPSALARELLELVTVAVMHRFHSHDWFTYLSSKIPLIGEDWRSIVDLEIGTGVVFAAKLSTDAVELQSKSTGSTSRTLQVRIRERLTADRGSSKKNSELAVR